MDCYENAYEKLKGVGNKKDGTDLDDFEEFMRKVEEVNKMVHALTSNNKSEIEEATQNADLWLKNQKKGRRNDKDTIEEIIHDGSGDFKSFKHTINKTTINEKAIKETKHENEAKDLNNLNSETMSQEAFMKSVEEDAKKRSEDRKQRKKESDAIKENAKKAFLMNDFEKALDLYNKAINVRRDSYVLYVNRALTLLKLGLFSRALTDCETSLKLNETCFKAALYKGKALFRMGEDDKADKWISEVLQIFPNKTEEIREYQESWKRECDSSD